MYDDYGGMSTGTKALAGLILGSVIAAMGSRWVDTLAGGLTVLVGAILLLAGGLQSMLWIVDRWLEIIEAHRHLQTLSPQLRILEAAHALSEAQLAVVPALDYESIEVDVLDQQKGLAFFLWTNEGRVPFTWLRDFLGDCGVTSLRPVRSYSEGTAGYEYARAFTAWCVAQGYAFAAEGPKPAQWTSEQMKSRLQRRFGFEPLDLDDQVTMTITDARE